MFGGCEMQTQYEVQRRYEMRIRQWQKNCDVIISDRDLLGLCALQWSKPRRTQYPSIV